MIISRTPFRISFFGGGTDYPAWFLKNGGAALSTTIDKYCYITCRHFPPFFAEVKHRIVWSHIETVPTISNILHPAVREGLKYMNFDDSTGLEIHHQGDLPARSGMGSSSAFAVGLINALSGLRGQNLTKSELARKAIELEHDVLKENVGCQDQVAVAYGGMNIIRFQPGGEIIVKPLSLSSSRMEELQTRLFLLYTGTTRSASSVAADVIANISKKERILKQMQNNVDEASSILTGSDDLDEFGRLLHENWILKCQQSDMITNSTVDGIYKTAMDNGAIGGKLLGAGVSGFMLFYIPLEKQDQVKKALSSYLNVPFKFENQGSTLILNSSD
ncbi:MAG: GHMP family kinase ATP-binding protein [Methanoregula sp.]